MSKRVLLDREQSSMASSWHEYLCLMQMSNDRLRLSTCRPEWLGSIYDLVPEDERYDKDGELRVPEVWEGRVIVGLRDGEYLETDELLEDHASEEFSAKSLRVGKKYCAENEWTEHPDFANAWRTVEVAASSTTGERNVKTRQDLV